METKDVDMNHDDSANQEVVGDAGIEYTTTEELKELGEDIDQEQFFLNIIQRLTSEDWKENFYGFDDLRRFYKYGEFEKYLPKYQNLIIEGVENLRSSICKNSLMLVHEIFTENKDLAKVDENGETTPYAEFTKELVPVVTTKIADDKVFLASIAKTNLDLISKHCYSKEVTNELCELSRSKNIVISSEASAALKENCNVTSGEFLENPDNVSTLLRTISEDLTSKRQPFSKNAKLILKSFKDKIGDTQLEAIAKEVFQDEDEVK